MDAGTRSGADHFAYQVDFSVSLRALTKINNVGQLFVDGQGTHVQGQSEGYVMLSFPDQFVEIPAAVGVEGKDGGLLVDTAALQKAQLGIG